MSQSKPIGKQNRSWLPGSGFVARIAGVVAMGSLVCGGCAKEEPSPAPAKSSGGVVQSTAAEPAAVDWDLAGIWLGLPTLDESRLDAELAQLDVAGQTALLEQAQVFLSTTIAVEYRADGSVQKEIELVTLDNRVLSDSATGTWKLTSKPGQPITIDVSETASDGSVMQGQVAVQVGARGDRFELVPPVTPDLARCGAKLVFERQPLDAVTVAAETSGPAAESR